ncbi:hypothetical protein ACIRF8_10120 [Streptomyces sp. NPDC102406]|uniref:hypothetical protein n=1 Tax=Streptomyces sp. NPDC102406 TaxID=3366171 RepID=UPI0037FC9761
MDTPFTFSWRVSGEDDRRRADDVTEIALAAPDGSEVQLTLDDLRGFVLRMDSDPDGDHFHEFEIRPGAANLFFVKAHRHERRVPAEADEADGAARHP